MMKQPSDSFLAQALIMLVLTLMIWLLGDNPGRFDVPGLILMG